MCLGCLRWWSVHSVAEWTCRSEMSTGIVEGWECSSSFMMILSLSSEGVGEVLQFHRGMIILTL